METIRDAGARFQSLSEPWADTTMHAGKMIITVFAGIAEFERDLIRERTTAGRSAAMKRGVQFVRPPKLIADQEQLICRLLRDGSGVRELATPSMSIQLRFTGCRDARECRGRMMYPVRRSVRVVLLNDRHEVLLMCMDDPRIRSVGESYRGRFWTLIGGQIERDETVLQAAAREAFEETGICEADIQFGPVVWFEELDLVIRDGPTRVKQQFVVGRTSASTLTLAHLTEEEPEVVKRIAWFSLETVRTSAETIYPVLLPVHLPRIIAGDYPEQPLDVSKMPEEQSL